MPDTAISLPGPTALRALAGAFSHLGEFDRFVQGLQAALERSQLFEQATITLDRALIEGPNPFTSGTLTVPLPSRCWCRMRTVAANCCVSS